MLETSSMQSQGKIRGIGSASWRGEDVQGVKDQDRASRLGKGRGKGHSPWEFTMEPQASPNPAGRRENEGTCNLTSKLLWPEHWAVCNLGTWQEERGFNTQQERLEPDSRQNFLLKLLNSKLARDFPQGLQEQVPPWGLQKGSFLHSVWGPGAGLKGLHHAGEAKNGRGHLSHSHVFGLVFFTHKLLCQLPGNPRCNHCAGRFLHQTRQRRGSHQGLLPHVRLGPWPPTPSSPSGDM